MVLTPQAKQHLAQAEGHLDTADRCLARQLHVLSTLGGRGTNLDLAEAVFETMLHTHALMTEHKELIERALDKDMKGEPRHAYNARGQSKGRSLKFNEEATLLLSKRKLRPTN